MRFMRYLERRGISGSGFFQNHFRNGVLGRVRDRDVNAICAEVVQYLFSLASDAKCRHAVGIGYNLNVMPRYFSAPTRFQRF